NCRRSIEVRARFVTIRTVGVITGFIEGRGFDSTKHVHASIRKHQIGSPVVKRTGDLRVARDYVWTEIDLESVIVIVVPTTLWGGDHEICWNRTTRRRNTLRRTILRLQFVQLGVVD